ncbi:DUF4160 domain-containing protein [Desulfonatronum lacustre]|uniref:DUF4160 domain-containing protein n=1 Tax=Desulfonatronum lacustre TaxID=66849 RepID=UPI0004B68C9C|nr:DUF4160 domain-containing protein [Desulfonatronum lacustre]
MNDKEEKLISETCDRGELKLEEPSADLLRKLAEASENSSKPGNELGDNMPEIARFYGIIIKLFFSDHLPAHFHAVYGEYVGLFNIETLEMIEGDLPKRAMKLVLEWARVNQEEMKKMWDAQEFRKLPPLE